MNTTPTEQTAIEGAHRDALRKLESARQLLNPCRVCPRACGVDRSDGASTASDGACGAGGGLVVSSINLHHGEEPPISGTRGSGTVFLTGCNLSCVFCQNFPISQLGAGRPITTGDLAARMVDLQQRGAHNINFVSPTHYTPQIMEAVHLARGNGLRIPIVWNSNGYESVQTLRLLEGFVDVYLPDFKYWETSAGRLLSGIDDYPPRAMEALDEMHRQRGSGLILDDAGMVLSGMIVRHLILPQGLDGAPQVLEHLASRYGRELHISLMSQYFPAHRAATAPPVDRGINLQEYEAAVCALEEQGMDNGWLQDPPEEAAPGEEE